METRDPAHLADLVRRHRTAAALSQEALAERAGVSVRAISDLERGVHRTPRLETVRLVADAFGLSEADRANFLTAARPHVMAPVHAGLERSVPAAFPLPSTRLIGRETEKALLAGFLAQDGVRLVTLTGPGGTGKTRLAMAVAGDARGHYPDGVCFVDLSRCVILHSSYPRSRPPWACPRSLENRSGRRWAGSCTTAGSCSCLITLSIC